ncbi:MAG: inositol monophosphatase family protein [Rhodospirillales bacterium]
MNAAAPDSGAVAEIIRETAAAEVMPRFGALSAADIFEKGPGDVVTQADLAMEAALRERLTAAAPGADFIGEEAFAADPAAAESAWASPAVWIVDPVDGTRNFAKGEACFAVIIAFARHGETVMGWIYDPVSGAMCAAERGAGAFCNGERLAPGGMADGQGAAPEAPAGYVNKRLRERMARLHSAEAAGAGAGGGFSGGVRPVLAHRLGSAGREYMELARGRALFARFSGNPKPWDHAAGTLLVTESGGFHALTDAEGGPYRPGRGVRPGTILAARSEADWNAAAAWTAAAETG